MHKESVQEAGMHGQCQCQDLRKGMDLAWR